jgi:uncharacterized protein
MTKGQVISGEFGKILVRQKAGENIELGELLISDNGQEKILLQAYDLIYGSQISKINLELLSGLKLEDDNDLEFMDEELRNYNLAMLKNLLVINNRDAKVSKTLPNFFSTVREIKPSDIFFLTMPKNPLSFGNLRSGSKIVDVKINLEGDKVLAEHILIPAATGRGKSNLTSCMLWDMIDKDYCGVLVLDPHDEYFGRNELGLKDHPKKENVIYYSLNPPAGQRSLKINIKNIKPIHFNGAISFTEAQNEALQAFYRKYKSDWVESVMLEKEVEGFQSITIGILKRKLASILNLKVKNDTIISQGVFDVVAGATTINDICKELESGKIVITDTSSFSGQIEILIGSIITTEIFSRYKRYKIKGQLKNLPIISIVLEEAPRVLGKEIMQTGSNIFSTIAREGRKFKVGLIAITQLPSLIQRQILANMNTKIILGIEMAPERQAIIDSASQDLTTDSRNIASLDKGEAIITSNFTKFAIPIKIPFFPDVVKDTQNKINKEKYINKYSGVKLK